jgi:hypothetical protein
MQTKKEYVCKTKKCMYLKFKKHMYDKQTKIMYEKQNKKYKKKYKCHFYANVQNTLVHKSCIPRIKRCCEKYLVLSVIYLITFGAILSPILNMLGMK